MTQSIGPYRLTVSIILIISLNIVFAQPSIFNVFTTSVENGLSHNDVRKVFQDKRGFIWLGTYDGLCRYDGSSFKTYLSIASDTSSISHNTVNDIWEDSSGNLWIATQNGLNRFNIKTESFLRIYISTSTPQTLPFEISQILPDSKANLWLATSNFGLCYYDRIKNKIFQFLPRHKSDEIQEHLKNFGVSGLCFDTSNSSKIWLACREGLFSFDIKNQTFRNYFYQNKFLTDIIQTEANQLWMSSWEGGLIGYDVINNKKINIGKNDIVSNILRKSDHELWIADMINGIGIFDLKTLKVRYIKPQAQIPLSVSIKSLSNISKTGELIWFTEGVATPLFKGVETFDPSLNNFQLFPVNPIATFKMLEVFPDAFAFSKTTDKSYMSAWLGDGLYIMNQEDQVEQIIRFKNKDVLNVKIDQFEHVWASSGQTLLKLNKENNILQEYNTSISKKLLSNILVLHDDPDGYLWVGDINGNLIRIDSRTNSSTHFKLPAEKKVSQNINPSILCMLNDQHGNLWIGTGNGLYVMDKQKESFRRFVHLPHDTSTLVQNQISKMAIDSKGQIWICNQMDGLQVFDTKTGQKVNHFTKQSGLPSDRIYNLIIDKNEDIWMIHPFGISRYTPDTRQILTYELKDGLPLARTDMEITHRPDGYIYFSAYNAFYRFHPDSLFTPQPAPLTFTSFKIFEKEVTFDTVVDFQEIIQLHHDENFITIGFKALNQYKGHNVNYTWQLEGVDDDWTIPTSSRTTASYSNLSPDTYTFRVKAVMEGSQINPVERILKIVITPAWWQTIWFKVVLAIILGGALYQFYTWRISQIRRKENFEKELAEFKLQALRVQMNPHFIFNSLTSIYQLIQSKQNKEAALYLTQFSKLIRLVFNISDQKSVDLETELTLAKLFMNMEKLRFEDKFVYEIDIHPDLDPRILQVPPMILQPYLENAVWHGLLHSDQPGKLHISVFPVKNGWKCTIEDNGIGREAATLLKSKSHRRHESKGMEITEQRLRISAQLGNSAMTVRVIDKKNNDNNDSGTIIELYFQDERLSKTY